MLKRVIIVLLLIFLFTVTWSVNKAADISKAFYQLIFLALALTPLFFLLFDKSAEFLYKILSRHALFKLGIFCLIILWGYSFSTGLNSVISKIDIGKSLSTGLIEFFIMGIPVLGIFLLFYTISGIMNINSKNTNILLFLFFIVFALYGGALWIDSSIPYNKNIKSLILFSHLNYHILFFIVLPIVAFSRHLDIKKIGLSIDIRAKDLKYFGLGIATIFFLHCAVRAAVGAFQVPNLSLTEWLFKITYITFIIALPEELLVRGIGISVLEEQFSYSRNKTMLAIIITSILEGLLHYRLNIFAIVFITLSGFLYGYIYIKTRKLVAPVLTHILVDALFAPYPF